MKTTKKDSSKSKNHAKKEIKDFEKHDYQSFKTNLDWIKGVESNTNNTKINYEKDSKHHC